MTRQHSLREQKVDFSAWPTVDARQLSAKQREIYELREQALLLYLSGETLDLITTQIDITASQLPRLLKRCLQVHPDGRSFGFRGLVPHVRVTRYERRKNIKLMGAAGGAGAFSQLLERFPSLEKLIRQEMRERRVWVFGDPPKRRVSGLANLHAKFLKLCREEGLKADDYPLAQDQQALRSLSAYVKRLSLVSFESAARLACARHIKGPMAPEQQEPPVVATRPLEVVEFDGHRIDVRLRLKMTDPAGVDHVFELERIWILVIIDVFSRAVLGYRLVLDRQYSAYDVIRTVEAALAPHRPRQFVIPGLVYPDRGGFPNGKLSELAYACWDEFRFDNAKAHLAEDTLRVLCQYMGCHAHLGPVHDPDERPFIERFFGTFTRHLCHRLPGATPSSPKALQQLLAKSPALVTLEELADLVEVMIAHYNGAPHSSLSARSPLEHLEHFIRNKHSPLRWLAESRRRTLCLLQTPRRATVRGSLSSGVRPYVHLYGARYTCQVLACMPELIGQALSVYYNPDDMRTIRAFLADGTELGTLAAASPWTFVPHTLQLRREILRLRRQGQLRYRDAEDPVAAYLLYQQQHAKGGKRQAANKLAKAQGILQTALPLARPADAQSQQKPQTIPYAVEGEVEPVKLSIGSGHAY